MQGTPPPKPTKAIKSKSEYKPVPTKIFRLDAESNTIIVRKGDRYYYAKLDDYQWLVISISSYLDLLDNDHRFTTYIKSLYLRPIELTEDEISGLIVIMPKTLNVGVYYDYEGERIILVDKFLKVFSVSCPPYKVGSVEEALELSLFLSAKAITPRELMDINLSQLPEIMKKNVPSTDPKYFIMLVSALIATVISLGMSFIGI